MPLVVGADNRSVLSIESKKKGLRLRSTPANFMASPRQTSPGGPGGENINDLVAVAVQLGEDHGVKNRKELVDSLFSGIQFEGRDNIQWNGDVFTAVRSDELRKRLFQLFGANLSLETVDKNIQHMINMELGWLEQTSNDSVVIKNGEISADLDNICQMVMSSLSLDIVNKVKLLLQNIHSVLSGDSFFGQTQQIDVNLVSKNNRDLTCIHTRYTAETKKRAIHIVFLGGSKRSIQINFSLRKIGISQSFADDLVSSAPTISIKDGQLQRIQLPEPGELRSSRTAPQYLSTPQSQTGRRNIGGSFNKSGTAAASQFSATNTGTPILNSRPALTIADVFSRNYLSSVSSTTRSLVDSKSSNGSENSTPESPSRSITAPDMPMLSLPMPSRQLQRHRTTFDDESEYRTSSGPSQFRRMSIDDSYGETEPNSMPPQNRRLQLVREQLVKSQAINNVDPTDKSEK